MIAINTSAAHAWSLLAQSGERLNCDPFYSGGAEYVIGRYMWYRLTIFYAGY